MANSPAGSSASEDFEKGVEESRAVLLAKFSPEAEHITACNYIRSTDRDVVEYEYSWRCAGKYATYRDLPEWIKLY